MTVVVVTFKSCKILPKSVINRCSVGSAKPSNSSIYYLSWTSETIFHPITGTYSNTPIPLQPLALFWCSAILGQSNYLYNAICAPSSQSWPAARLWNCVIENKFKVFLWILWLITVLSRQSVICNGLYIEGNFPNLSAGSHEKCVKPKWK